MTRATLPPIASQTAPDGDLAIAYRDCAQITRTRARNFYFGLRLSPEPWRSAVYAVYAWMREADDIADAEADHDPHPDGAGSHHETHQPPAERLAAFAHMTRRALAGGDVDDLPRWWRAIAHTAAAWNLPAEPFDDLLDGMREDIEHQGYASSEQLDRYCYRVGSSAGQLCVAIWGLRPGVDPAEARQLAILRGIAFQRTNILRDVAADAAAPSPRFYIPRSTLDDAGLSRDDLLAWRRPDACGAAILAEAARARDAYDQSARLDAMIRPECAHVLRAMTTIYSSVLRCIERSPSRAVLGPRAGVPLWNRLSIAAACMLRAGGAGRN